MFVIWYLSFFSFQHLNGLTFAFVYDLRSNYLYYPFYFSSFLPSCFVLFCFILSYLILSYHVLSSILNSFYFLQFIFLCSVFFISYTVFYCPSHLIKSPPPNQFLTSHTFKTFLIDHINSIFISSLFPFFLTYNLFYYHFAFYQIL